MRFHLSRSRQLSAPCVTDQAHRGGEASVQEEASRLNTPVSSLLQVTPRSELG